MLLHKERMSVSRRSGFTLTELVVSTALTSLIMSQIVVALVTSQRLFEATVADLELSLQSRALREKILFNITPEEGGLMNVCLSELAVENPHGSGKGKGLKFKSKKGQGNRLALGENKKLLADRGNALWLATGASILQTEDVFQIVSNRNAVVTINLDLMLQIANRKYGQQHQAQVQIMNE